MEFIRDQGAEWCHSEFIEAAQRTSPFRRLGIDLALALALDYYAAWRAL